MFHLIQCIKCQNSIYIIPTNTQRLFNIHSLTPKTGHKEQNYKEISMGLSY